MKHKVLHIVLLALTFAILVLPAIQQHTQWLEMKPLNGVTVATAQPKLSVKTFMTGEYQRQEEQYLSENIGFREPLTRLYNQMAWSLFRAPQNKTIFVNDDNWIFNDFTIKHFYRQSVYDFAYDNEKALKKIDGDVKMLCQLQSLLKEYGVQFFVCLAPGKDMVCAEHVPEVKGFDRQEGIRAIDIYPSLFDSLGINYLDFSKYCMEIKDTVSYPLYLKSSSHWSTQAAVYAADTLFRYMESLSGFNLHGFSYSEPYLDKTRNPDADLEEVMNLLWPIETGMNYYTNVSIDDDSTAVTPNWLVVGDSYFWEWQYNLPLDQLFDKCHYWYYNSSVFNDPLHSNVGQVDLLRELLSMDIVMLLYSPTNLYNLNRDFLTKALFSFYFEDSVVEDKLERIKQDIKNTPEWCANIVREAESNGQDPEEAIDNNAKYLLYSSPGLFFDEFEKTEVAAIRNPRISKVLSEIEDPRREAYRKQMMSDGEWLNSIKEKAQAANITIEEAMEKDIDWLLQEQNH